MDNITTPIEYDIGQLINAESCINGFIHDFADFEKFDASTRKDFGDAVWERLQGRDPVLSLYARTFGANGRLVLKITPHDRFLAMMFTLAREFGQ